MDINDGITQSDHTNGPTLACQSCSYKKHCKCILDGGDDTRPFLLTPDQSRQVQLYSRVFLLGFHLEYLACLHGSRTRLRSSYVVSRGGQIGPHTLCILRELYFGQKWRGRRHCCMEQVGILEPRPAGEHPRVRGYEGMTRRCTVR